MLVAPARHDGGVLVLDVAPCSVEGDGDPTAGVRGVEVRERALADRVVVGVAMEPRVQPVIAPEFALSLDQGLPIVDVRVEGGREPAGMIECVLTETRCVRLAGELVDRDGSGVESRSVALILVVVGARAGDVGVAVVPDE